LKYVKGKTAASLGRQEDRSEGAKMLRNREDAVLEGSGFEQVIADLWVKGGVCYKRTNDTKSVGFTRGTSE
jgi:hypothetical protein